MEWEANPRANDEAVGPVASSLQRFGWGAPILARRANREIVAGHTRHRAAIMLGMERVPVRFLDLVPFSGAGSEMIGALLGGWDEVVGIEQSAEYVEIARARLTNTLKRST